MEQNSFAIAKTWVFESKKGEHKRFPGFLTDVDNEILGSFAKDFRKKHRIKSKEVAAEMDINTASLSLLENGRLGWSQEILLSYIDSVIKLTKEFYHANFN